MFESTISYADRNPLLAQRDSFNNSNKITFFVTQMT